MKLFRIWKSKADGQWYWHLRAAGNHRIIFQSSDGHKDYVEAIYDIARLRSWAVDGAARQVDLLYSADGRFLFHVRHPESGQIIGRTQTYKRQDYARHGIEVVRQYAKSRDAEGHDVIYDPNA